VFNHSVPFGGYKQSGWGHEFGKGARRGVYEDEIGVGSAVAFASDDAATCPSSFDVAKWPRMEKVVHH
jgi:hypothetical protein